MKNDGKRKLGDILFNAINILLMCMIVVLTLYPFVYIVFYSFSTPSALSGGFLLYPKGLSLEAYKLAMKQANIVRGLIISVARSTVGPILTIAVTSMVAYVLTKEKLIGRKFFFPFFFLPMFFTAGIMPIYVWTVTLHLNGTFLVYILPYLFNAFYMILIKTYIEGIPKSLEESAMLDGANDFIIFIRIFGPVCLPIFAAILLFDAVFQWNSFMDTLYYNAQVPRWHTLQYVLANAISNQAISNDIALANRDKLRVSPMTMRMAMTVITIVPIACVYPFLQKYFVKGLLIGSVKG